MSLRDPRLFTPFPMRSGDSASPRPGTPIDTSVVPIYHARHGVGCDTTMSEGLTPLSRRYGDFGPSTFGGYGRAVLLNWNTKEGIDRLRRSEAKQSFFYLAHHFQPQINPLYCGIATAVILLNAIRLPNGEAPSQQDLEVQKPEVWGGDTIPFRSYSQWTLLNDETDQVKSRTRIRLENITRHNSHDASHFDPGLALDELKGILEVYGLAVELRYADENVEDGATRFRAEVDATLRTAHKFVVVNFVGNTIGAATGGHISPLGAYDRLSDSVLILDVAGHKNPWYWAPLSHLYQSMHELAPEGRPRGWLMISDRI